jgi:DNA repair exonuclease SbcCD ATPase subunit
VILDEVFGSQDANRRELIFESLANLKSRFPQMILITHLEELKHKVETLIELAPQPGGWSEVRVNGELV